MSLVLIRIDDRVIHGQVVEGWARVLRIKHILVVDEAICKDDMRKMLYCMAVPNTMKVSFKTIKEAAQQVKQHEFDPVRTLVLFSEPAAVLEFVKLGVQIKSINVGGIHYDEGKRQVLKFVSVTPDDVEVFHQLAEQGIEVEARAVPTDEKIPLLRYL